MKTARAIYKKEGNHFVVVISFCSKLGDRREHAQPQRAVARILKGAQVPKFFLKF